MLGRAYWEKAFLLDPRVAKNPGGALSPSTWVTGPGDTGSVTTDSSGA